MSNPDYGSWEWWQSVWSCCYWWWRSIVRQWVLKYIKKMVSNNLLAMNEKIMNRNGKFDPHTKSTVCHITYNVTYLSTAQFGNIIICWMKTIAIKYKYHSCSYEIKVISTTCLVYFVYQKCLNFKWLSSVLRQYIN